MAGELPPQGYQYCAVCGLYTDDVLWDWSDGEWQDPVCWDCYEHKDEE